MSMAVVINADDLGLHVAVRRAVERLAAQGSLTSASILANGPDLAGALAVRGLSLGAHLNILRGRPLSPVHEVRSLVGDDGCFLGDFFSLYRRYRRRALNLDEVRLEWSRQVDALRDGGVEVTHVDGEKHTHALPRLFEIACEVAAGHAIPFLRCPLETWSPRSPIAGQLRVLALRWWLRGGRERLKGARVSATDFVWGLAEQGERLQARRFARWLRERRAREGAITSRSVEVVVHPGEWRAGDPELHADFGRMRVRALWRPEFTSLSRERWPESIAAAGGKLTGFAALEHRGSRADA